MKPDRAVLVLPKPLHQKLEAGLLGLLQAHDRDAEDFSQPAGEAALTPPDSVSWEVFKNPATLFIGAVAAVVLELAEPRVRTGVWEHTSFRSDPLQRLRRTGLATMLTVYGPRSRAERMIAKVERMHAQVRGVTPQGRAYWAADPELLDWVQATASFGFLEAYSAYVRPLSDAERDRFYAEGEPAARLFGATTAPTSQAALQQFFEAMLGRLEASDIVLEFLQIMRRMPALPRLLRPMQGLLIRAAVELVPAPVRERLNLGARWNLRPWQRRVVRAAAQAADRLVLCSSPVVQSCRRMGLPDDYLYTRHTSH